MEFDAGLRIMGAGSDSEQCTRFLAQHQKVELWKLESGGKISLREILAEVAQLVEQLIRTRSGETWSGGPRQTAKRIMLRRRRVRASCRSAVDFINVVEGKFPSGKF